MPLDVVCRQCRGIFHETNDEDGYYSPAGEGAQIRNPFVEKYNPDRPNAAMFRLKEPYTSYGWTDFPKDPAICGDALVCPACDCPYNDASGRIETREQPTEAKSKRRGPKPISQRTQ